MAGKEGRNHTAGSQGRQTTDRYVLLDAVVERLGHMADVVEPDEVSGTALTLTKAAAVIALEFGSSSKAGPS
jgi:hypothetical protein